jgi:hypothetical protein
LNAGTSWITFSPNITSSPAIITGLTTGQTYNINIRAVNAIGAGAASTTVTRTTVRTTVVVDFKTVGSTTWKAPVRVSSVEYLVVAGGGGSGGGFDTGGGGGGGGGMVRTGSMSVTPGTVYNVSVGDGGIGGNSDTATDTETSGEAGDNSIFSNITAIGGGKGFASRRYNSGPAQKGGSKVSGTTTASVGGSGGGSASGGGGGGGNNSNGSDGVNNIGGAGGSGVTNSISGTSVTYGAGGSGAKGGQNNVSVVGAANTGNGAIAGGANTNSERDGAKGGSGIVILKYSY